MYMETGQGSALSAGAHLGTDGRPVDQQTLEARAYAVARDLDPLLVNTVVGFIGPEYLYDGKQIIRAGLEDHFCGKLLGLPMGVDVCYTNHAEADQDDMDTLLTLLGAAGAPFVIAVPGADDVMLGYQSLSFHDVLYLRHVLGLRPAPEFEAVAAITAGWPTARAGYCRSTRRRHALRQLTARHDSDCARAGNQPATAGLLGRAAADDAVPDRPRAGRRLAAHPARAGVEGRARVRQGRGARTTGRRRFRGAGRGGRHRPARWSSPARRPPAAST